MLKRLFSLKQNSWVYNLISLLNVGCGLSITALVWYKYSATQESDILLLATSSTSLLAQLSLVGVEQVLYFYADEGRKSREDAEHFFKLAFTWSLISGFLFALVFILLSKLFVSTVATGFTEDSKNLAGLLMIYLSPQLVMSPCLHVLRARWSLDERFGRAYLLSAVNSFVLLVCLVVSVVVGTSDLYAFGEIACAFYLAALSYFIFHYRIFVVRPVKNDFLKIKDLIVHSAKIKGANAIHNFFVQALITSLLSRMPVGSISIFQYAKRLADGVFAITAGPQVMIYHSRCATSVSAWNKADMRNNAVVFLKSFLRLFFAMAAIVYVCTPFALSIVAKNFTVSMVEEIQSVYVGISLWYLIIGVETLLVGVVLAMKRSLILFGINFTFLFLFFVWSRVHHIEKSIELIYTTSIFQLISFGLFGVFVLWLINKKRSI